MPRLPVDLYDTISSLLVEAFTLSDREAILLEAIQRDPVLPHIDMDGAPAVFTAKLIARLSHEALVSVLRHLPTGAQNKMLIERVCNQILEDSAQEGKTIEDEIALASTESREHLDASVAEMPPIPEFLPDDQVVRMFVGRTLDLENVLSVARKQRVGQKSRPRPGTSLFWFHGFGGMGKSWLIRRLAYLVSKPRRSKRDQPAVVLVDWDPDDRWSPLRIKPSDPLSLFRAIATRATQVYGPDLFRNFWIAFNRFESSVNKWTDLNIERFQRAIRACAFATQRLCETETDSDSDTLSVRPDCDSNGRDRDVLKAVLEEKGLWSNRPSELARALLLVQNRGPLQDEVYESWATLVATGPLLDRPLIVRPTSYLADRLRECLRVASDARPTFLLLDTCETLNEWTEYWLRRLLAPLLTSAAPFVVAVATRSRPDRYLRPGERGGWSDELAGRLSAIAFDKGRYFTATEIEELLTKSGATVSGVDRSRLADRLHRVFHGLPLAVGLLLKPRYSDLLGEVAEWGEIAGPEVSESKAIRTIYAKLADRLLGDIRDIQDRLDVYTLVLLPGLEERSEDELEWRFQIFSFKRWRLSGQGNERMRDRILSVLWGDPRWKTRLIELEQTYGLIADGDLHALIRRVLRTSWREMPPAGLLTIVDRIIAALEACHPTKGEYDEYWVTWTAWWIGMETWHQKAKPLDLLGRALVVGLAYDLNVEELQALRFDIEKIASSDLRLHQSLLESELIKECAIWTSFEQACLLIVRGLAIAIPSGVGTGENNWLQVAELLGAGIPLIWSDMPSNRKRTLSDAYFRAVAHATMDRHHPKILEDALELSEKLRRVRCGGASYCTTKASTKRHRLSCGGLLKRTEVLLTKRLMLYSCTR